MLPPIKKVKLERQNFPQLWQAVIFRNYGFVRTENLAKTLRCDIATIEREALRLGLENVEYDPVWEERGYMTTIRNNWHIIPYEQITSLLDITAERLEYILVNDDFLNVKLGDFKPECAPVYYAPLSEKDEQKTRVIADTVRANRANASRKPFAFFTEKTDGGIEIKQSNGVRIVHGYLSPCGDAFIEESEGYLPDSLLKEYAKKGVNGLWFHGVLSALSPYPFDESASVGYETRRKNLSDLIARCKKYGIKIYIYLNEPRGLAEEKFGKYAYLMGRRERGFASLCFEREETQTYLYEAIKDLFTAVPEIGGVITITMSENLTHCRYRVGTNCPVCANVAPEEIVARINNTIMRGMRDSGSKAELIANRWGWSSFSDWTREQALRCIDLHDKDVSILSVSEDELPFTKGGVESKVCDYSISNVGPSEITIASLTRAKEKGHKTYAKVQVNNSWECSTVPYLPVYDLFYKHFKNLAEIGVYNYMLTWTLGGYPSPTFDLCAEYAEKGEAFALNAWYETQYGKQGDKIHEAVKAFCAGFEEYPFSIDPLYYSPKTLGPANMWDWAQEGKISTMVCYAYDDYETWIKPYPYEVYVLQMQKLLALWEKGLEMLQTLEKTDAVRDLEIYAQTAYVHFKADLLQTQFSYYKRDRARYTAELATILEEETAITKTLISLSAQNPYVGYEASNHYFYNERNLLEKLLNLQSLIDSWS